MNFSSITLAQIPDSISFKKHSKHLVIYAGMGLGYTNSPSLNDFIRNEVYGGIRDSVKSFSVGLEVFGGIDYELSKTFGIGLDYSYFIKSKTYYVNYLTFDYFYFIHQPLIFGNYIISGRNYSFKFGLGAGYHFGELQKSVSGSSEIIYHSSGPAIRIASTFSAKMSTHLSTYINAFIHGTILSSLKDNNGNILKNNQTGENVNLSGFGVGIRLGFSYYIF